MSSFGDSVHQLVNDVQHNELRIRHPPSVAQWPLVGDEVYAVWQKATPICRPVADLQRSGRTGQGGAGHVASIGGGILQFVAALIIAAS